MTTPEPRASGPAGSTLGRSASSVQDPPAFPPPVETSILARTLAEVKGQAQFLLYLADQIEESLQQLDAETDPGHAAFLCKLLAMYSSQLETKHHGLGEKIAETCQEVYLTVREFDANLDR
ncbi:MAG: hypothetical protein KatS3mg108_1084 [Isosphaeraceae bacterium]|jgi:hypothetical protein|nr:MAG: hypothetical protein KatS3mg108_1084 [Isosphaeraceae bacterium]